MNKPFLHRTLHTASPKALILDMGEASRENSHMIRQSIRPVVLALVSAVVTGCMATLSPQGAAVRPVTERQKEEACEFLTIVAESEQWGLDTGADARSAMIKVRNAVAEAGGNGMLIISTDPNTSNTTVTAEALTCDFSKIS